jgi:hypothetical protein
MTTTLDLRRDLKHLYVPSAKKPALVEVPPMRFFAVDGVGQPGGEGFQAAMQALFTMAYSVRFAAKKRLDLDYPVMASEGLYWNVDGGPLTPDAGPDKMAWTLQLMLPEQVPHEFVEEVRAEAAAKGKGGPLLGEVQIRVFAEGMSVQIMHIGPYDTEPAKIECLIAFATEQGYEITGRHHEIYMGDPNRTAPEKLKTALRYGVTQARRA